LQLLLAIYKIFGITIAKKRADSMGFIKVCQDKLQQVQRAHQLNYFTLHHTTSCILFQRNQI